MIASISSSSEASAPGVAASISQSVAAPAVSTPVPASAPVTVEISKMAQVKQLDQAGSTIDEIVTKTGLDKNTINQYLGK